MMKDMLTCNMSNYITVEYTHVTQHPMNNHNIINQWILVCDKSIHILCAVCKCIYFGYVPTQNMPMRACYYYIFDKIHYPYIII